MHFNMLNSEAQWRVNRYVLVKLSTNSKKSVYGTLTNALTIALSISCHSVLADSFWQESRWAGGLNLAPIGLAKKSQFSVEHKSRRTNDLNHSSKTSSFFSTYPLIRLDYMPGGSQTSLDEKEPVIYLPQLSSQLLSILNPNAEYYRLDINMNFHFGQSIIIVPVLQVTKGENKGDANDVVENTFILQSLFITAPYSFSVAVRKYRMGLRVYGPVFKAPPKHRVLSLDTVYKYAEPGGYKNLSMLSMVMWKKVPQTSHSTTTNSPLWV